MSYRGICLAGAALLIAPWTAGAAPQTENQHPAAVMQSTNGKATPVPQNVKPPPLNLTDQDRQKIRDAVAQHHDQITLGKKASQEEKDFKPAVGAKVPAGFAKKYDALPQELIRQLPALKEYSYLLYDNQIMIVDPMSKKVVDMFPAS